jgi:hypothetical protein
LAATSAIAEDNRYPAPTIGPHPIKPPAQLRPHQHTR